MAYSGLGWSRKGGFEKPTLSGVKGATGFLGRPVGRGLGAVGGAALGAGALAGGAISQSIGFTPFIVGATAIGAAGKKGANAATAGVNRLGSLLSGKDSDGKDKKDTNEELKQTAAYGLLSVEKLDAIYNNVVDIRKVLADQDPESQEREKALDEKVKQQELIDAIRGIGTGGGSGGKDNKDWSKLLSGLGLGALLGTAALIDEEDIKKLDEFFEGAGSWADSIQEAVDNIMEFIKDLDGFFEGLGIEFGGAAMMGTAAGMRRAGRSGRLKARGAQVQARKQAARQARQEKRRAAREQKRATRLQERAKVAEARRIAADEKAKAKAAAKARAAKLRSDRMRARSQRAKAAAARIKERISKVRTPKDVRGPRGKITAGGYKAFRLGQVRTPKDARGPRGKIAAGGNAAFRLAQSAVGRWTGMGKQTGAAYKTPAIPLRTPNILDEPSRLRDTAPQRSGPMGRGGTAKGLTTLTPAPFRDPSTLRDTKPRNTGPKGRGRVAMALSTLTPIATKIFGGRSTGTGGRPGDTPKKNAYAEGYDKITWKGQDSVKPKGQGGMLSKVVGGVGTKIAQSGLVKDISTIANTVRGRPPLQMTKPKIPPKLALAMRVLPKWAVNLVMKAMGETGKATAKTLLRIAGPILLGYEVYKLNKEWKEATKGQRWNWSPLGDEDPADLIWQDGIKHLAATYGGGYFGAVAGSMVGTMMGGPVGTVVGGLVGGVGGAMLGSSLYESLTKTDQEKIDEKKAELQSLLDNPVKKGMGRTAANAFKNAKANRMERITELESEIQDLLGTSTDEGNIVIINSSNVDQSRHSSSAASSTAAIRMGDSSSPVSIYDDTSGGFW